MHEDPGIPNYGKAGRGIKLEPGMTLAIEPMVIAGKPGILELDDGWTIIKEDGTDIENVPFKETNNYVRKILRDYKIYKELYD